MGKFKARELRDDASPDEVRRQLNEIQKEIAADLTTLAKARTVTELQLGDYTARYGDIVRMAPPASGARLILPPVNLAQPNGRVTVVVESVTGALTVEAIDTTVNGGTTLAYAAGLGTVEFTLTGNGWYAWSVDLDVPSGSVTNAKLANMSPGRVKGLQVDAAAAAAPHDLTGLEVGELLRLGFLVEYAGSSGTQNDFPLDVRTNILRVNPGLAGGDVTFTGFAIDGGGTTHNAGGSFTFVKQGAANKVVFKNETGSIANNQLLLPGATDLEVTTENTCFTFHYWGGRFQVGQAPGPAGPTGATGATGTGATGIVLTRVYDDFELIVGNITGSSAGATVVGTLQTSSGNWVVSGTGTVAFLTGESGAPGIVRLSTTSSVGIRIHKAQLASDGFIFGSDFGEMTFRFRANQTSNININLGLVIFPTFPDALLIQYNPASNAHITIFARKAGGGGGDTTYDTGITPGASTWHTVRLVQTSPGNVDVYVDGSNLHTITTNIPTAIQNFYAEIYSSSGTVSVDIDVCELLSKTLSR